MIMTKSELKPEKNILKKKIPGQTKRFMEKITHRIYWKWYQLQIV